MVELAAEFVNDQLWSLCNIAGDCVTHYTSDKTNHALEPGCDFALREFYCKSKNSPVIKFEFLAPHIEFVCNHKAILHPTIQNASLSPRTFPTLKERRHLVSRSSRTFCPASQRPSATSMIYAVSFLICLV